MAKLALSRHGREILKYPLPNEPLTIGRDGTLELDSTFVSRLHLRLEWEGTRLYVTDLGSVGTLLDGEPLEPGVRVPLRDGAVLQVGPFTLRYLAERAPRVSEPTQRISAESGLIGRSFAMGEVRHIVRTVASRRVPVLITGETGTGKGEAARAIHAAHPEGQFVPINVASIVESLFESELFGHERGAFTGADVRRDGAFHQAHRGTLFLDEIGELPLPLQTKLLTALEERLVRRVGANQAERVDVRVIAATNRDLEQMVAEGSFRHDLFSRIACVRLAMPPLRERPEDIPELVRGLLARDELGVTVTPAAMELLSNQPWPDNVRGLRNALERAAVFAGNRRLDSHHFDLPGAKKVTAAQIRDALARTKGEREAALIVDLSRSTMRRRMKEFGIPSRKQGRPLGSERRSSGDEA